VVRGLVLVLCVVLLAGCGGGGSETKQGCRNPKEQRALARLNADLSAIRRAAKLPVTDALKGGPEINKATDRFLLHVETAPIDNLQRNRLIDHAAALLSGSCTQCFQALEAARPIPGIAHGDQGCATTTAYAGPRQRYARASPVSRQAPAA
jgi:hypothetical protein